LSFRRTLYSLRTMADKEAKVTLVDVPDPSKLQEHGISIDAPTPTQFVMPDPWAPSGNGQAPAALEPTDRPKPGSSDSD
jgi:hypothetical protein